MVMTVPAPTAMDGAVQVTVCPATPHTQKAPPLTAPMVKPAGTVSVTVTVWATLGPLFLGVRVRVCAADAFTGLGAAARVSARSAWAVTFNTRLGLLLPGVGSA